MIKIELYIENKKADMFNDVSVTIVDSIKKAQDVGQMFTSYTQQFKLPASRVNNKIFKHFYRFDIVLGGYDGRRKHSALIKLNGADYKKGYIKLNEVDLKDNKAESYNVQFFGEMTSLKDQFGEDLIEQLDSLNKFNHTFNIANVRGGMETSLIYNSVTEVMDINSSSVAPGEIVYPLITHTKGLRFSTTNGLRDVTNPSTGDRLDYIDLKPGLQVREILTAIEAKYGLTFGGDFIDTSLFKQIYIWCHKVKGGMETDDPTTNIAQLEFDIESLTKLTIIPDPIVDDISYDVEVYDQIDANDPNGDLQDWDKTEAVNCGHITWDPNNTHHILTYALGFLSRRYTKYTGTVTITPVISFGVDYTFKFFDNENDPWINATVTGGGTSSAEAFTISSDDGTGSLLDMKFKIVSTALAAFKVELSITASRKDACATNSDVRTRSWTYERDVITAEIITEARIPFNLPKIKVIDFMRALFKMFNLVAYPVRPTAYNSTVELVLQTLDEYYSDGSARDISRYVNIDSTTVERVTPFKTIEFQYEKPSTFLAKRANQISSFEFGNLTWDQRDFGAGSDVLLFDGGGYKVKLPFEKLMYERLKDDDDNSLSEIIYGWFVGDFTENTPEPELGKPILFFLDSRANTNDDIVWADATVTNTAYNSASNVSADLSQTLNFGAENDEYLLTTNKESLFKTYYSKYINGVYDLTARRYKIKAFLPPEFIYNYKLNNKLIINSTPFNVESLTIDLLDGQSTLDLLKLVGHTEYYDIIEQDCYSVVDYVVSDYWCHPFATVGKSPLQPRLDFTDRANSQYLPLLTLRN